MIMEKKAALLIVFVALVVWFSCDDREKFGFGGNETLTGKIVFPDSLSKDSLPAIHATVLFGFGARPTSENFSFKTVTDSLGSFTVKNLIRGDDYWIRCSYPVKVNGVPLDYSIETQTSPSSTVQKFLLSKDPSMRKIRGQVKLKVYPSSAETPLAKADVYVGYKQIPTTTTYLVKAATDENGFFSTKYLNLKDSTNFKLYVRHQSASNTVVEQVVDYIKLKENGGIILVDVGKNTFIKGTVTINDYLNQGQQLPVKNAEVYVGLSSAPTTSTYALAVKTEEDGSFLLTGPLIKDSTRMYYLVRYELKVNSTPVWYDSSFTHSKFIELKRRVTLKPKTPPGVVTIRVKAANNTPQPATAVCVFANEAVFNASQGCAGSFFDGKTNEQGKMGIVGLQPGGTYYLRITLPTSGDPVTYQSRIEVTKTYPQFIEVPLN